MIMVAGISNRGPQTEAYL